MQLTPVTADLDEAREWFEVLPEAMGVEGLVVKGAATRYTPGRRDAWIKVNSSGVAGVRCHAIAAFSEVSGRLGGGACARQVSQPVCEPGSYSPKTSAVMA